MKQQRSNLRQRNEQNAAAFLSAAEAQVTVGGVEGPCGVAAGVRRPHWTGSHLVEHLATREAKQSQDVISQCLFLQDPEEGGEKKGKKSQKSSGNYKQNLTSSFRSFT